MQWTSPWVFSLRHLLLGISRIVGRLGSGGFSGRVLRSFPCVMGAFGAVQFVVMSSWSWSSVVHSVCCAVFGSPAVFGAFMFIA